MNDEFIDGLDIIEIETLKRYKNKAESMYVTFGPDDSFCKSKTDQSIKRDQVYQNLIEGRLILDERNDLYINMTRLRRGLSNE